MIRAATSSAVLFAVFSMTLAPLNAQTVSPDVVQVIDEPDFGLPPFDIRVDDAATATRIEQLQNAAPVQRRLAARDALMKRLPGAAIDMNRALATPEFIRSRTSFLTQAQAGVLDEVAVVKAFVDANQELFGVASASLDRAIIKRDAVTAHNNVRTVWWSQHIDGVPVVGADLRANVLPDGRMASIGSRLLSDGALNQAALKSIDMSRSDAVSAAATHIGLAPLGALSIVESGDAPSKPVTFAHTDALKRDVRTELVFFPVTFEDVRPAHRVFLAPAQEPNVYEVIVDATTGDILQRTNHTHYGGVAPATYRVWQSDSPMPMTPGPDTPNGVQAPEVPRDLVTLPFVSEIASPDGWIEGALNETLGNNIDAGTDLDDDEDSDLPRPQGAPFRVFDFPIDISSTPDTYREASAVQAFYIGNWYHDLIYDLGFTEPFGNFQADNFGRGGVEGDRLSVHVHDGQGFNNANFNSTGADGDFAYVQMFIFDGPSPDRDGALDTQILIHELSHGTSIRIHGGLTGGQARGMGEGWSDFYAMCMTAEAADPRDAIYAMSGFATLDGLGIPFTDNYYFGIRRYPYTTDLTRNPLTYGDISDALFDVDPGVPRNPVFGSSTPGQVHNVGEVWCSNLWECRALLIDKYGFSGNQLIMQLVTDGMKLTTSSSPNLVQSRDAILLADRINNDGENVCDLWAGFAKRGLGADAFSDSVSTGNVEESFTIPIGVDFIIDGGAPVQVMAGIPESFNLDILNNCGAPLTPGTARLVMTINGGEPFDIPLDTAEGATGGFTATIPALACDDVVSYYIAADTLDGEFTFPAEGAAEQFDVQVVTEIQTPFVDDFESDLGWFVFGDADEGQWERAVPAGNNGFRGDPITDADGSGMCYVTDNSENGDVDGGATTLFSPTFDATGEGDAFLNYYVWYVNDIGTFTDDSLLVEISNDDGMNWTVAEELFSSTDGWELHSIRIADIIEPTSTMRIQVTASDLNDGSVVEAGFDGVAIQRIICDVSLLIGDLNGDGAVDGADLAALLANWGLPGGSDLDGDGTTNGADLAALLANWTG